MLITGIDSDLFNLRPQQAVEQRLAAFMVGRRYAPHERIQVSGDPNQVCHRYSVRFGQSYQLPSHPTWHHVDRGANQHARSSVVFPQIQGHFATRVAKAHNQHALVDKLTSGCVLLQPYTRAKVGRYGIKVYPYGGMQHPPSVLCHRWP